MDASGVRLCKNGGSIEKPLGLGFLATAPNVSAVQNTHDSQRESDSAVLYDAMATLNKEKQMWKENVVELPPIAPQKTQHAALFINDISDYEEDE